MNNPFYKLLESLDSIDEGAMKRITTIGNKVRVDDGQGNITEYDKDTWDEMNQQDESLNENAGRLGVKFEYTKDNFGRDTNNIRFIAYKDGRVVDSGESDDLNHLVSVLDAKLGDYDILGSNLQPLDSEYLSKGELAELSLNNAQVQEAWDTKTETPKSERGKYKGKTKAELKKMLSNIKKTGPHKKGSAEYEKMKELQFALRAKNNWGKVDEGLDSYDDFTYQYNEEDDLIEIESDYNNPSLLEPEKDFDSGMNSGYPGDLDSNYQAGDDEFDVYEPEDDIPDLEYDLDKEDYFDDPLDIPTGIDNGGWNDLEEAEFDDTHDYYDDDYENLGFISQPQFPNDGRTPGEHMKAGYDDDDYSDSIGDRYDGVEFDVDDINDEPEYKPFDLKRDGKRLRAGTPVIFDDDIGGGEGVFIEKSPSGFFGTAERNGKTISLHLNDIAQADLNNENIYEEFDSKFNDLLNEEITVTRTNNAEDPENDTITITGTGEHVDMLADVMKLAGMEGGHGTELPQDAEIPVNISPEDNMEIELEPSMGDMMSMMDEPKESIHEEDDLEEGIGDSLKRGMKNVKRGMQGWGDKLNHERPLDMMKTHSKYTDDELDWLSSPERKEMAKGKGEHSPQGLQQKLIDRQRRHRDLGEPTDEFKMTDEGIGDDIKRGMKNLKRKANKAFWWDGNVNPKEMEDNLRMFTDDELLSIASSGWDENQSAGDGSPRSFQIKAIQRELRRRGLRDFSKYGDSRKMTDEDFANEPNDELEVVATPDAQLKGMSGGINKPKQHFRKEYPGDNIMNANLEESADDVDSFLNLYKVFKVK